MTIPKTSRPGQSCHDTQRPVAGSAQTSPPASRCATPIEHARAGFDLSSVVRQVLRTSPSADLDVIAKDVYERIPEEHREAALRQALRVYVQRAVTSERVSARAGAQGPSTHRSPATSWKVAGIREAWQRRLQDRVYVGTERKFLRDCTYDDLQAVAEDYEARARQNKAAAREAREFARLIDEHQVGTFGELPVEVLAKVLGGATT